MQPSKQSIAQIFEPTKRYVIPLFQRAYVWNEEDHWEPLWTDIVRQTQRDLTGRSGHFLGAVVMQNAAVTGGGLPRAEMIDGQQRLTTLQVLLKALTDVAGQLAPEWREHFARLTRNNLTPGCAEEDRYKLWPGNADRRAFRAIQDAEDPASARLALAGEDGARLRLLEAYDYFSKEIHTFITENGQDFSAQFQALHKVLFGGLQIIAIELEAGDDPQMIFETLNGRGEPLLPSDLIRNDLFLRAAGESLPAEPIYEKYWAAFDAASSEADSAGETRYWHMMERQGRLVRPRIDLFVFHYLVMHDPDEHRMDRLYGAFSQWAKSSGKSVSEIFADIARYRDLYRRLLDPNGQNVVATTARRLKAMDLTTAFPILLFVLGLPENRLKSTDRDRIFQALESYVVRRFFIGGDSKTYNKTFLGLLGRLRVAAAETGINLADFVEEELLKGQGYTTVWPDDEAFQRGFRTAKIYVGSRLERARMILTALEERRRLESHAEPLSLTANLTIEHLLPQSNTPEVYPYGGLRLAAFQELTPEDYRLKLIHTIGNLTMLTPGLNTIAGNHPFPDKTKEIRESSDLRLNAFTRAEGCPTSWSEDQIVARSDDLFETARKIWARPQPLAEAPT